VEVAAGGDWEIHSRVRWLLPLLLRVFFWKEALPRGGAAKEIPSADAFPRRSSFFVQTVRRESLGVAREKVESLSGMGWGVP
jgi:hypothetical protein